MGEQDEAGRADALPPELPPPPLVVLLDFLLPPHPAATSARITTIAPTAPSVSRLLTLPPQSRIWVVRAGLRRTCAQVSAAAPAHCNPERREVPSGPPIPSERPKWRNW